MTVQIINILTLIFLLSIVLYGLYLFGHAILTLIRRVKRLLNRVKM